MDNFERYFSPTPSADEERVENELIEKNFWEALDRHEVVHNGENWNVYTEKEIHNDYCVVFKKEDSEDYMLFFGNVIKKPENTESILEGVKNMSEEDMHYLLNELVIKENSPVNLTSRREHPNMATASDMESTLVVNGNEVFFNYVPRGSGVGVDALKESMRSVGGRNRK